MAGEKPRGMVGIPIGGILLLFLGVVFLLQTLNVLPWGLWGTLWRFWPVLIIIVGLGILLRRYNVWLVSLLILAILGACLGIAIWQEGAPPPAGVITKNYSEPLGSLEHAQIEVNFTAGSITIGSLLPGSSNLVEVDSEVRNGHESMKVNFQQQDSEGRLSLSTEQVNRWFWGEGGIGWEVNFTRSIPLAINIESAVSNMELALSELKATELRLDIDAGNCRVKMPSSAGATHAYIEVDAANLEVAIPDDVAAKIKADVNLGAFDVDTSRFPKKGDYYISPGFEGAENRVELEINCDIGKVQVK